MQNVKLRTNLCRYVFSRVEAQILFQTMFNINIWEMCLIWGVARGAHTMEMGREHNGARDPCPFVQAPILNLT